jgi:hypothetical protein
MESKDDLLMEKITAYYMDTKKYNTMCNIIAGSEKISLRIIDWFVTNYSKKNNVIYQKNKKQFIVYLNYKSQLKAYSKKYFDPFCRRKRIIFQIKKRDELVTTVGQLNFFKWAIESGVITYIRKNIEKIENDMTISLKKINKEKIQKKRKELSISATKKINKHNVKIIIDFN